MCTSRLGDNGDAYSRIRTTPAMHLPNMPMQLDLLTRRESVNLWYADRWSDLSAVFGREVLAGG